MISAKSLMLSVWLFIFSCCVLFWPTFAQSQVGTVTLSVGNGNGPPSSTDNPVQISLDNLDDRTTGVQFDICRGSYLSLSACGNTARTPSVSCSSTDLGNGCDRILFFSFGGNFIEMGTGPIITLEYDVSVGAPDPSIGYCQDITLENVTVTSCEDNGSGGCTTGPPYANVTLEDGQFCFVNPPTCLGVSPGSGMQAAQGLEITITGENTSFVQGVSVVGFEQSGVTVTDTIVDSSTQVRVVIDIAEDASIGFGDVTVTTDTEVLVCANGFQVLEKVETCLSVLPGSGMQGDQGREVTIVGDNTSFAQGVTEVSFQNLGITVTGTTVDSPTQLRVTIDVARTAPTGTGNVTVTTGAEVIVCTNAFEVIAEVIFCLDVSPGSGMQDSQGLQVTITGERTNFEQGVTEVSFENPDITVTDTIVDFPTQLRVLIDIPGNADTGTGDVTVTTGSEIIVCFDAFEVLEKVFEVTEIRESNPTSASFTVSWITDGNANGIVHYSMNPDLSDFETAYDDRGMFHLDDTHHVSMSNLEPETTYYYEIISGGTIDNNGGLYYSFTTMKIPSEPPPNCPVYGWVYMEDGIAPAEGAMVYLQVVHGGEQSYWISALVNSSGIWVLNLGNLYSTVTDDALPYSDGDPIFLEVQGGSGRTFSAEYAVPAICPLNTGSIVLPHFIALDMALYTGFNLISFPFDPMTDENFSEITHTAYSLIEAIPECNQAFSWDASTQRWLTALDIGGGSYIGDDFPIEAGRGYFVKCTSGATSTFYGKEIAHPFSLTFEPGFNLVSIPYPIDYYTACSLIGAVSGSSKSFSWSPDFQKWLSALVVEGGLCIGDDFAVERDKGYFVHSDVYIGNWVPGVGGTCSVDGDCDDSNICTDDTCVASVCQYTDNTVPCDDTLFCNGSDTCSGGSCSAHAGSPCPETECNTCQEDTDSCFDLAGTLCTDDGNICTDDECDGAGACGHPDNTAPCDDTLFCNGSDTCSGGSCSAHAGSPCPETECNTCQEDTDSCFDLAGTLCADDGNICTDDECDGAGACGHPDNTAPCDDTLFCNGSDTCSGGSCSAHAGSPCPETECNTCQEDTDSCFDLAGTVCTDDGNVCTDDECDGVGACGHPDNTAPCDDGLFCTQVDECLGGQCTGRDDPCLDNGNFCDGLEYCEEDVSDYICSSTGDPCDLALTCNDLNDVCDVSDVTLIIADAYGYSGTIDIELDNGLDFVSEIHVDVCDIDLRSWLHIDTASCNTTTRSTDFSCAISDLGGGCVRIDLTTAVAGLIDPGTGAVAQMNYTIDAGTPPGDFADLNPQNNDVRDAGAVSLLVTPSPGMVGAAECVDAGDCDDSNVCTDDACVGSLCQFTNNTGPCDDTLFCNGIDTCSGGSCSVHAGSPCPETECNTCQEATDSCFDTAGTSCTDDGNICTDDQCDGAGACGHPDNTAPCDDTLFCNGIDTCSGGSCSVHAGSPCPETECNTCQEATDSCFDTAGTSCTDDGNICTDDQCDGAGACGHPDNTAPCDDTLFCNGSDTCGGGSCSVHAGSPCPETECNTCQEATDSCFDAAGTSCTDDGNICTDDQCDGAGACGHPDNTAPCDDTLFCNGNDTCGGGSCSVHAGSPCPETECNTCQEATDSCFDSAGTSCTDDGNICTDDECDGSGACGHPDNTASCDDGLFCTQVDECLEGQCIGSDDPCIDSGDFCDGVEYCEEDIGDYICNSTGDPCELPLTCDELGDVCDVSDVTVVIADAYGYAGTIDIELDNPLDYVSEVYLDVCDIDLRSWLHIDSVSCSTTTRSSDFSCAISDLGGGCVRVDLTTAVAGLIDPSTTGPEAIARLNYTIDANASLVDYADLEPQNIDVQDDTPVSLSVTPMPGMVRAVE